MQCDSFNRNYMTCILQLCHNILAERHEKGADGGEGGSCRRNIVMIYKMVVVVATCKTDMVFDLNYKIVVVAAPCRVDMVLISTTRCW